MGNLIFLIGAIGLSVAGSLILWLRHRPPRSPLSGIADFNQEMSALRRDRPGPGMAPPPGGVRGERHGVRTVRPIPEPGQEQAG